MGPKKDFQKREKAADNEKKWTIEDAVNSDSWRCVVMMAVERTRYDSFVVEEFMEASFLGKRRQVTQIDFETCVMKILNDFANGELPYKYTFLLNFSSVFQEAVYYIAKKMDVPILILVKVVKALLLYLREESLNLMKKKETGLPDPIQAMAERPANFDSLNAKKSSFTKKGDNGLKLRPPSVTKEDTKLIKRGERAKDDDYIDDAPRNAYFNLYVLLTGFYNPNFPLELIKANIPLHSILCIDTSLSGVKRDSEQNIFQKSFSDTRENEIQNFWNAFLKKIWEPEVLFHFKDVIFQVYMPRRLLCEKQKLREFIYREISYLMYDLSDFKRQLGNYLEKMHVWDMADKSLGVAESPHRTIVWPENLPEERMSVPIVLRCIIDAVCEEDWKSHLGNSSDSINSKETESQSFQKYISPNTFATPYEACGEGVSWSQELEERGDFNLLSLYYRIKELDMKYDLDDKSVPSDNSEKALVVTENTQATVNVASQTCIDNMEETLLSPGVFRSYWTKYNGNVKMISVVDYCFYTYFMTKVLCPYQTNAEVSASSKKDSFEKIFEPISNVNSEMRKPQFTVTEGSRSILQAVPYNVKNNAKDFFRPEQFKVVSPEKLKASSAPEFRVTSSINIQRVWKSDEAISGNRSEGLMEFVNDCLILNAEDFDFLEFLNGPKLVEKEQEHCSNYNCIDDTYSLLSDCIFLRLHNRKDCQNVHHETFNQTLRTVVGLRDFYEYVLEDEKSWVQLQEELYLAQAFLRNTVILRDSFRDFADSDFWQENSIKFKGIEKTSENSMDWAEEVKIDPSSVEKVGRVEIPFMETIDDIAFEGYNVCDMAVQFSGLKTIYYTRDCSVTVQLIERLYGNQNLGVHVTQASHTLHLYSYVCPEPHILDPFTFHVTYKNGALVAFGRRFIETFEEVEEEEKIESATTIKSKKNSSEFSTRIVKKLVRKSVKDEDFIYDMAMSLPNGLSIRTVAKIVKPCYIKQCHLANGAETARFENSRLFLPNGSVVKMMNNGTVQILKVDSSIITANLSDLIEGPENGKHCLARYEFISGEGNACIFERGKATSQKRFKVFQNTDMSANQVFFRRSDGTNSMLQNDGTLYVQFKDGTKMSSSLLLQDDATEQPVTQEFGSGKEKEFRDKDSDADFVFVFTKVTAEHPDYATVIYDGRNQKWKILLPYDSTITVEKNGHYFVELDKQAELKVETGVIQMNGFSCEREPHCTFTANLSVFENTEGIYCHMADSSRKMFIVEGNSNCYILDDDQCSEGRDLQEECSVRVGTKESEVSEFIASADLQISPSVPTQNTNKLFRENKYFVLRRDLSGVEILHREDVRKALTKIQRGSLVFTQNIPGTECRCFVLVAPLSKENIKKWTVNSILPNIKYEPGKSKRTSSSTYGVPPSWMHPFPKRKFKFVVPKPLTCRVFVETKKTDLSPAIGNLECCYCELNDVNEQKFSQIPREGFEEYLKRLSNDDQDLLTEIYSLAAASLINEKKKLKPTNSDKLRHYLELSRYYVAMREYHSRCITYDIIPSYFHHPAGMSWLILNELLLLKLELSDEKAQSRIRPEKARHPHISESMSDFSNEEIEYNLSLREEQSFSSLSCRSNLSAQTEPPILAKESIYKSTTVSTKDIVSSPNVKCSWQSDASSKEPDVEEPQARICEFRENDMPFLGKKQRTREIPLMSLEDLMHLGLI